ncbi:MAG: hypothetical protein ACOZDY_10140 [Pseudomonadota bacterium]
MNQYYTYLHPFSRRIRYSAHLHPIRRGWDLAANRQAQRIRLARGPNSAFMDACQLIFRRIESPQSASADRSSSLLKINGLASGRAGW